MRLAFTPDGKYFGAGLGTDVNTLEEHLPQLLGNNRTAQRAEGVTGADVWEISPPLPAHMIAYTGKLALERLRQAQKDGMGPEDRSGTVLVVPDFTDLRGEPATVASFSNYGEVVLHEEVLAEFAQAA
jgi:hypothetical protein